MKKNKRQMRKKTQEKKETFGAKYNICGNLKTSMTTEK